MDTFDLWTKQNIIDIIFHFNEKNYELLRNFINWYDNEDNSIYILSTRYFYSNECLKLLLSTINAFIDVKNNNISEEDVVNELDKEIDIKKDLVMDELEKKINIIEKIDINELEKKNDSDEYVINDDYYFTKDIVKKEENVEDDAEDDNAEDDNAEDDNAEDDNAEDDNAEDDDEDDDAEDDNAEDDDAEDDDAEDDDAEDDDAEDDDAEDDDAEDDDEEDKLIINKFSNNEIVLLLNILEEDTKKFSKHNYIIGKCKEELFFYNNFYLGFTAGLLFYFLFKFV